MNLKKSFITCMWFFLFLGTVSSYFESRYRCNVQSGSITISMNSGEQKCFSYLAGIHTSLLDVQWDILQANNYITRGTDVDYRTTVLSSLTTQQESLENKKNQALIAMQDFERSLYNQIKSLLKFYLADQREGVLSQVEWVRWLLQASKESWNGVLFQQYLNQMESLQYKLFLLDRIQFSHDFEELVPFLKEYLYGGGQL